jgi:hypothetical protein
VPADSADLPKRAPGLWEEKFSDSLMPGELRTHRMCVDEKLHDFFMQFGMSQGHCAPPEVRQQGPAYVIEAVCKQAETTMHSRTIVTGDLRQAYKAEISITYEPAFMGRKASRLVAEARHLGACPAGMRGGDVISSDGTKFNFYDLQQGNRPK